MKIEVTYFAMLREQRGISTEQIETETHTAEELYQEVANRYDFTLDRSLVRAAINGVFVPMATPLKDGDIVVLMPPVAGG